MAVSLFGSLCLFPGLFPGVFPGLEPQNQICQKQMDQGRLKAEFASGEFFAEQVDVYLTTTEIGIGLTRVIRKLLAGG